jgi:hypothetical protein
MTAPIQCTDYTGFSIEQMLASVSEPDDVTMPQLAAWQAMARSCEDLSVRLQQALGQLLERWVPTPNSAAAAFQAVVQRLTKNMAEDAESARMMQPALARIVDELALAKLTLEAIADRQNRYATAEWEYRAAGANRGAHRDPLPPDGWREDLHYQAMVVLKTADANIAAYGRAMPTLVNWTDFGNSTSIQVEPGGAGESARVPAVSAASLDNGNRTALNLAAPRVDLGSLPHPVLAGSVIASDHPLGSADDPATRSEVALGPFLGPPSTGVVGTRSTPINGVIGGPAAQMRATQPSTTAGANASEAASGRANFGPMMPGAMGRPSGPGSRSTVRPGGRPALWSSQRRRKESDPTDPWSVARGVPAVIEPPEIPDHDPGPGVIGLHQ